MVTDRPSTLPRGAEVESSAYGADGSTSQPITEQYQLSSTQQPVTSSEPVHQHQTQLQQYQTTTHHVTHPAAAAASTSTSLPSAGPAEHTMAATRQQVDTSVPGAPYHPSSSIEQPTTSNGIAASSHRHEDLPPHYYEDIDSDGDDVADSSRGPVMCKTIVLTAHGGLDKLQVEERVRREPSNGEVLVKVGVLSVRVPLCLPVYLSSCLFLCLFFCLILCLSAFLFIQLSICLYVVLPGIGIEKGVIKRGGGSG